MGWRGAHILGESKPSPHSPNSEEVLGCKVSSWGLRVERASHQGRARSEGSRLARKSRESSRSGEGSLMGSHPLGLGKRPPGGHLLPGLHESPVEL